jgi:hypothetical protein
MNTGTIVGLSVVSIIAIVCFGVTMSYTYMGIGQTDDASVFNNFGYPLGTGIFALAAAIVLPMAFNEDDITLAVAVMISIMACALAIGAVATGSITH